ncbi:MAG: alpha/beta hydrolase [Planctomycetota bacterium]|nr:MAG: alpha/beta hydrolase [Planctomycetota bacterium]
MLSCNSLFYYPTTTKYSSPQNYRLAYESVSFGTEGGPRLHGWYFPAVGEAAGTVLHLHGNAGNITGHFEHIVWLPAKGWNVLCFDYRGYGQSEGRVTREGTIADAHAALDYLLNRPDVDANRIVGLGQSLGGAVGIVLAAERQEIRGLAVDGAFDNYRRITAWHIRRNPLLFILAWWLPHLLITEGYEPIDYVARIAPRPLFIMQGTKDRVVDPRTAKRLYDAAGDSKELWMIEGADHYQAMDELVDEVHPRLLQFFERCVQ